MDRHDLHKRLIAEGIDASAFDVLGSGLHPAPGDVYVLRFIQSGVFGNPNYWVTYYSERGKEIGLKRFTSEEEACCSFLSEIKNDASTWRGA